jgi:hypothetical protein
MTNRKILSTLVLISACTCKAQPAKPAPPHGNTAPFACNLRAFQPEEKTRWRKLIDKVMPAVTTARELNDGYTLRIDANRASLVEVAEWIGLERKCCPFFDFQVDMHGEDGTMWLSLKGREGVKQFIEMDFPMLRGKLEKHL